MLLRMTTLILLCLAGPAIAQQALPPRLMASVPGAAPIELQKLSIRGAVSGSMADTTVTMVFYNPNSRVLEGNLQFPLAEGQQVTAFGLDIDGQMRPAVPVEKERGRQVFEEIVRRGVDPALLELTQGNNFKLRVYPIAAHGTRTVELSYSELLHKRNDQWVYRLPPNFGTAGQIDLSVTVNGNVAPTSRQLRFEAVPGGYSAHTNGAAIPARGIEVLTAVHKVATVFRQQVDDTSWFVAEVPASSTPVARRAPRVIGLLWDASGSGARRALDAELAELDRYFAKLDRVEVRLTRLRDRPEARQVFHVVDGNWRALRQALEKTVYDGASAINDWQAQADVDQYLLFSDGLSNYGGDHFPDLQASQQLFTLNSSPSADLGRLAALADRAGGELIQVDSATPGSAAHALLFQAAHVEQLAATGATDLEIESHTVRDGMLRLAGRMLAPEADLELTLGQDGTSHRVHIHVGADAAPRANAAAIWASFRLRALEGEFEAHRSEIARIGKRFGIPTRETSLIVLETLADYLRYEITPPASYAAQYKALREAHLGQQSRDRDSRLDTLASALAQRKKWWNAPAYVPAPTQPVSAPVALPRTVPARPVPVPAPHPGSARRAAQVADARADAMAGAAIQRVEVTGSYNRRISAEAPSPVMTMSAPVVSGDSGAAPGNGEAPATPGANSSIAISLKKWVPNAPYMERLPAALPERVYQIYLDQKPDYANSSAFYLDAADILIEKGQRDLALRVLSNLAEMDLENRAVLRILGYRLLQADVAQLAVPMFENVRRLAGDEPQSFRDLGLALAAAGRRQEAVDTLYEVALRPWARHFPDIEIISMADMNALIDTSPTLLDTSRIDPRLLASLPLDIRVVMTWDADNTDIDLHVIDPNGDRCYFGTPRSRQGGAMSRDVTGGYGPEEFSLRRAIPGKYRSEANFYGNRQQVLAGATTVQVKLSSHFGTPSETDKFITMRLKEAGSMIFVGEFEVVK
jgi:Ca-activated chloride channel family protein